MSLLPERPLDLLVVEDSPIDIELVSDALREAGIVARYRCVDDAEGMAAALGEALPDAILADASLPRYSGAEALRIARTRCPERPFLFVTGTLPEDMIIDVMRSGASDVIYKHQIERLAPALLRALQEASSRQGQQAAEQALRASESRFRALVEQSVAGIYIIQDGRFCYANSALAHILGYGSAAELVEQARLADTVAPEDRARVLESIRQREAGEVESAHYTAGFLRRDGSRVEVEVLGRAYLHDGRPAVIGLLLDISRRRADEIELARRTQELAHRSDQLERFNRAMVGRELAMIELKRQVNALSVELGRAPPFASTRDDPADGAGGDPLP
jgi:PAS domain S-box-containing protein